MAAKATGAKAPTPGRKRKDDEIEQAAEDVRTLKITPKGLPTVRLTNGLVTMREKINVLNETGMAYEDLLPRNGTMPLHYGFVLWWIGRRQNGEPTLTFDQADREWTEAGIASYLDLETEVEVESPEA